MSKTEIVIVSAGHDRFTSGKRSPDGQYLEYAGNRKFASIFYDFANTASRKVIDLVGNSNLIVSLKNRVQSANKIGTKDDSVLIAIHSNAMSNKWTDHNGFTIFYHKWSKKSKLLAECIEKEMAKVDGIKSRGVKGVLWMYVLRKTKMPAVLVERFFHTCKKDLEMGQRRMCPQAIAISDGVDEYDRLKGDL